MFLSELLSRTPAGRDYSPRNFPGHASPCPPLRRLPGVIRISHLKEEKIVGQFTKTVVSILDPARLREWGLKEQGAVPRAVHPARLPRPDRSRAFHL